MRVLHFLHLEFHALSMASTTFNTSNQKEKEMSLQKIFHSRRSSLCKCKKKNEQQMIVQQRLTEIQKDMSQKPEHTVGVNKSNWFHDKDEVKDAANCLTSLKYSMSPQTPSNIDDNIVEDKTSSKESNSLDDSKNYPCRSVFDHKPTNKMTGPCGKEESSNIKMKNDDAFIKDCIKVVDLNTLLRVSISLVIL